MFDVCLMGEALYHFYSAPSLTRIVSLQVTWGA